MPKARERWRRSFDALTLIIVSSTPAAAFGIDERDEDGPLIAIHPEEVNKTWKRI